MRASPVKRDSPRIAQAVRINFRATAAAGERIVTGNRVGFIALRFVHVDAQNLAEQGGEILAVALWRVTMNVLAGFIDSVRVAPIADANVQETIRPKCDAAAIVIKVPAYPPRAIRVRRRGPPGRDHSRAL